MSKPLHAQLRQLRSGILSEMPSAQHLRLQCELAVARVNWFFVTVALLSAALLAICLIALPALAKQEAYQRRQVEALQRMPKAETAAPKDPLAAFDKVLSSEAKRNQFLRELSQQAGKAGLRPGRVEFGTETDQAGGASNANEAGFGRFSIVMPVRGAYPALQAFAFGLLAENPGLALEKIEMRREQASLEELEAKLHFVLYVESAP